jgi:hypothetical protein
MASKYGDFQAVSNRRAIDDNARAFYLRHGLERSRTDPFHLMILIKDIAALHAARQDRYVTPADRSLLRTWAFASKHGGTSA